MFRKGGNVGTGVMTGIVDRGNYAIGDRVQEQDITDYISLVKGGGQAQVLIQLQISYYSLDLTYYLQHQEVVED